MVALALRRLERTQQDRFARRATRRVECIKGGERSRPDPPVRNEVAKVRTVTVHSSECALQKRGGNARTKVSPGIKKFGRDARCPGCHVVNARATPVEALVD